MGVPAIYKNDSMNFLLSRCGEGIDDSIEIPKAVMNWYEEGFECKEQGYLVLYQNEFGYLYTEEHTHTKVDNAVDRKEAVDKGLISEGVYELLEIKAKNIISTISDEYTVLLGHETGCDSMHELLIFFPFGTKESDYLAVVNKL